MKDQTSTEAGRSKLPSLSEIDELRRQFAVSVGLVVELHRLEIEFLSELPGEEARRVLKAQVERERRLRAGKGRE